MFRPIVQHMASLAQCLDVAMAPPAVGRIVVKMGCRQHDLGRSDQSTVGKGRYGDLAAATVAPGIARLVPPPAVTEMPHGLAMRPPARLAPTLGPHEPDPAADLRPVDRVEVAQLGL